MILTEAQEIIDRKDAAWILEFAAQKDAESFAQTPHCFQFEARKSP